MNPDPSTTPRLIDGSDAAPATVLLAHGAGAPMDSPFMAAIARGLAELGWRVVRFEFPYMARMRETGRRQGPDRMPVLQEAFRVQVQLEKATNPDRPLFIGGKSMGGRVRTEHLAALLTPTLILQGERDGFGKRGEVEGYALSPQVQLRWITSGDHSFKPTTRSGLCEAENWATAVAMGDPFLRQQLSG